MSERSFSIHPRNWPSMGKDNQKKNTAKPYRRTGKGKLGKAMKRLNARRNAHSVTLKSLPSSQNPMAFKAPGRMK